MHHRQSGMLHWRTNPHLRSPHPLSPTLHPSFYPFGKHKFVFPCCPCPYLPRQLVETAHMTQQQITLVQNSWRILRDLDAFLIGDLFYSKLFFEHPELRSMFPKDMSDQYGKLVGKFNLVFARLHQLESLKEEIVAMARRHVSYGAQPKHYAYVGEALLWTLERGLGEHWTPPVAEAWQACYEILAKAMIEAGE